MKKILLYGLLSIFLGSAFANDPCCPGPCCPDPLGQAAHKSNKIDHLIAELEAKKAVISVMKDDIATDSKK